EPKPRRSGRARGAPAGASRATLGGHGPGLGTRAAARAMARPGSAAPRGVARSRALHAERPPRRLALLPGRRPDLVLVVELAARSRLHHRAAHLVRLAGAPAAVLLDRRSELPERPPRGRAPTGARVDTDCPLLHVRRRRPHRRTSGRLQRRTGLGVR